MYSNKYDRVTGQWTKKSYVLLKKLGAGGVGEIYLVQDDSRQLLACKLSTDIISITKEYRFLCKLAGKSYVPKVFDLDDFVKGGKTYHFFTMEYIQGYNLKAALKDHTMNLHTKLNLMCVILRIIKEINEDGYVYTDLKHENIMVDGRNQLIRLIDLGSLVQIGSTVKEYTPMYDRLCWGKGKRVADKSYQVFVVAILFVSLLLGRSLDPDKEKLDSTISTLKKKMPRSLFETISRSIEGHVWDCDILYKEISCAAENGFRNNHLRLVLDVLIALLTLTITITIFVFTQ